MSDTGCRNERAARPVKAEIPGSDRKLEGSSVKGQARKEKQQLKVDTSKYQKPVVESESPTKKQQTSPRPSHSPHHKQRKPDEKRPTKTSNTSNTRRKSQTKPSTKSTKKRLGIRQIFREAILTIKESYNAGVEAAIAESKVSGESRPVRAAKGRQGVTPGENKKKMAPREGKRRPRPNTAPKISGDETDRKAPTPRNRTPLQKDDRRRNTTWLVVGKEEDIVKQPPVEVRSICTACHKSVQGEISGKPLCRACLSQGFVVSGKTAESSRNQTEPKPRKQSVSTALRTVHGKPHTAAAAANNPKQSPAHHAPPKHDETIATRRRGTPTRQISIPKPLAQYEPAPWRAGNQKKEETKRSPPRRTTVASVWEDDVPEEGYPDADVPPVPRLPLLQPLDAIGQPRKIMKKSKYKVQVPGERMLLKPEYSPSIYSQGSSCGPELSHRAVPESEYEDLHPDWEPGWWAKSKPSPS